MRRLILGWLLVLLVAGIPGLSGTSVAQAQVASPPALSITHVDTSAFPDVKVYLRGENLGGNLADMPVKVTEDGLLIESVGRDAEEVGTQTALLLDASGSVLDPGMTSDARYIEVGNIARRLIELQVLSTQSDWLAAYAPRPDGTISSVQEWTRDHQGVSNSLYIYEPPNDIKLETPLYDLLFFVLDQMRNAEAPSHAAQSIVLFSDGLGGSSSLELDDALRRAAERHIPIHTVLLGPATGEGPTNMRRIATLTGGQALHLTGNDALDGLWQTVVQERSQHLLLYRSPHATPNELLVSVTLPDGSSVQSAVAVPSVSVQPAEVTILEPATDLQISKETAVYETPLEELEPKALDVKIEIAWPDDRPREITRVEYLLHTDTIVRTEPPFDEISFPISKLDNGRYTLRVNVFDELGMEGSSEPLTFDVNVVRPPAPPPPEPTYTILGVTIKRSQANTAASLLALLLGGLAVVIALRKPVIRERVADVMMGAVKAVTEPFMFNAKDSIGNVDVKARLTVEDPGRTTNLPLTLDLRGGTTRIGRAPEYANLVLDDPRISRLHCRITEDNEGKLCLYDEGGSSGTYVNREKIDIAGYVLQSDDVINIGPVRLRFNYVSDGDSGKTEVYGGPNKDVTEPFVPQFPQH